MKRICTIAVVFFCGVVPALAGRIIYVDSAGTNGTGSEWRTAFRYLQDALAAAEPGDEIRVAKGIYKPVKDDVVISDGLNSSFKLVNGVTVRGGFAGLGLAIDADTRNTDLYMSILSGDLKGNDSLGTASAKDDNCHHVISCVGVERQTIIEGFVITGGNASLISKVGSGAGMYNIASSPVIKNCIFTGNDASQTGGAIFNDSASNPLIVNCTFAGNYASVSGAAIHSSDDSRPKITSSILWGNFIAAEYPRNSQISGSEPVITYSCIQDWPIDKVRGNINTDPLFANASVGDFHLRSQRGRYAISINAGSKHETLRVLDKVTSPCIDRGDPDAAYMAEPQPNGRRVNIGAYGNTRQASMTFWKVPSDLNEDLIVNLTDFAELSTNLNVSMPWYNVKHASFTDAAANEAITWHVDNSIGKDTNSGQTQTFSFETIQKAINSSKDGDTVLVWPGTYKLYEPINLAGKAITLKSAAEPAVLKCEYGIAVEFSSGENSTCILSNFVITGCDIGIYVANSLQTSNLTSPTITNLTVAGNNFAGIYAADGSRPGISSCIFWNNGQNDIIDPGGGCRVRYSCIENGHEGHGNIKSNPLFADISAGDYHLLSKNGRFFINSSGQDYLQNVWVLDKITSPCIDAGDPEMQPMGELIGGGGRVNMGAYGSTRYASKSDWLLKGDIDRNGVVEFNDLANLAGDWLFVAPWIE